MIWTKNIKLLFTLSILTFTSSLYKYFIGSGIRCNAYMFYDYITPSGKEGKLLSAILYEVNYMFIYTVLLFLFYSFSNSKNIKNIIIPFLILSTIDIIDYFLFYKQMSSYKLPLLIALITYFNRKWIVKNIWKSK